MDACQHSRETPDRPLTPVIDSLETLALGREKKAELLFKQLMETGRFVLERETKLAELSQYADIINAEKFLKWRRETGYDPLERADTQLKFGRVVIDTHCCGGYWDLRRTFSEDFFTRQVNCPYESITPFPGNGWNGKSDIQIFSTEADVLDVVLTPNYTLQPVVSFTPLSRINRDSPGAELIKLEPGTTRPWPTIVFHLSRRDETVQEMMEICSLYLSHNTQVNVWVGIKLTRHISLAQRRSWWMGVAHRNVMPGSPPSSPPPNNWPPPIMLHELPPEQNADVSVKDVEWKIPTWLICHPQSVPELEPRLPEHLVLLPELFRRRVIYMW